ncbi:hypothetical protein [Novosphingobium guangzhouense]|uniref:Secreted protein n=1 Tax=Novosphingobium guangzhouense TaxID=1850347 RepID=A0A2K2G1A4_9SPHN|nr:hypothetical protein [Novosphingobium guangzhouense]PNU04807.1 hypothetical protein A8V01_17950 [Novosphingobium guangzhouense]
MRGLSRTLALTLAMMPCAAMAAEPVCISKAEATSLIAYALPQAINGTAKRCAPALPADAFLRTKGPGLASRYAAQKDRYWPKAKPALMKALNAKNGGSSAGMFAGLPDDTLRQMADVFVEGFVSQRIATRSCKQLDLAIDLLSPLPPENTAGLIALSMDVAGAADPKLGNVTLCKD